MKQILQSLKTGETEVAEVPCPAVQRGQLLVRTVAHPGLGRHRAHAGRLRQGELARQGAPAAGQGPHGARQGAAPTASCRRCEAVRNKLDQPLPLGYCNVGTVVEVGAGVSGFAVGDRVVSNGKHAEIVAVPVNLCARCRTVWATTTPRSPCCRRSRCRASAWSQPTLGEAVVVTGLGLIGLLTVQLLRAHGCRVLGLDFDPAKLALARALRRRGRRPAGRRRPGARGRGLLARPRRRRRPHHRRHAQQRAGAPGGADVPQARPHRPRRRHRPRALARRLLREGADVPGLVLLRPGPLRPDLRGEGAGLSGRLRALDRAAQLRGRARHDGRPAASTSRR